MNKQIEEMARTMCLREHCPVKSCIEVNCEKTWLAEALYNAGYRKASDVTTEIVDLINDHFYKVRNALGNRLRDYRPGYSREFIFDLVDVLEKRIVEKIEMKYESEDNR